MANHKQGLAYYNVDTDRYSDRRIKRLKKAFGGIGIAVYDYILCEVYRDRGCGLEWDEDTAFDVADYFGLKETLVNEIVKHCGVVGLFDKALLSGGVITSASIQRRYLEMSARAKRTAANIPEEWRILTEESAKLPEESPILPENSGSLPNTRALLKEKKSKVNKNNLSLTPSLGDESAAEPQIERDIFLEIFFFNNFRRPAKEVERFVAHYEANGWCRNGQSKPVKDRVALARCWEPMDKDAQRFPLEFLVKWNSLYQEAKKHNPQCAQKLLTDIYAVELSSHELRLKVSKGLKELMLSNSNFFNSEFFLKFYQDKRIIWL